MTFTTFTKPFTDEQNEIIMLRHLLCDLVEQNCRTREQNEVSSGFISVHCEAIEYLTDLGYFEPVRERIGRFMVSKSLDYIKRIHCT